MVIKTNYTKNAGGGQLAQHPYWWFCSGCGLSCYWLLRTTNTVRRLVLRKGGKHITLVTYGILGSTSRVRTVPVTHVRSTACPNRVSLENLDYSPLLQCSAVHAPFYRKHRFFLIIKDHMFKYQFNLEDGIFTNKPLFDKTVGLRRRI